MKTTESRLAWALLAPALTVLGVFGTFPIGYALFVSLHRWRLRKGDFVAIDHYRRALGEVGFVWLILLALAAGMLSVWAVRRAPSPLQQHKLFRVARAGLGVVAAVSAVAGIAGMASTGDPRLFNAFRVTAFYAFGTIPIEVGVSMFLAWLLFRAGRGRGFFRVLYFLPYVTPMIATAVLFRTLLSPHPSSLANRILGILGFEHQGWLFESRSIAVLVCEALELACPAWANATFPSLALVSVVLYNVWVYIGYDTVILLAGLSAIPRHYFEAAAIDGANAWQSFRHVTVPLISPALFFITLVGFIGTFKAFNHIYILRTAGARDTVDVVSILIFDRLYNYQDAGYASCLSLVLFAAILALTLAQNRLLGRRVFYGE